MNESPAVRTFAMAFPASEIAALAERYVRVNGDQEREDHLIHTVAPAARARGYLEQHELLEICAWKTPRSKSRVKSNSPATTEAVTRAAFTPGVDTIARIQVLRALEGVDWPTATAILHIILPDDYPLLDVRALESLQVAVPAAYSAGFVAAYVDHCKRLAKENGVTLRTLDRALWQYSRDRSGRSRGHAAGG